MQIDKNMESKLGNELIAVGAHFGYSKTRRHPSAKSYVFGTKNGSDIIDITKTEKLLTEALAFIKKLAEEKKTILFVSGKPESKQIIEAAAHELQMPYVENRWIGGTLTNFREIKRRIDVLLDLKGKKERGDLAKYTKKEQSDFGRQIEKMTRNFGGLVGMTKKPDALFVIDTKKEAIAVTEANKMGVPVIGLANTDCDLSNIDFPIVANDAARASIKYFVDQVTQAYRG